MVSPLKLESELTTLYSGLETLYRNHEPRDVLLFSRGVFSFSPYHLPKDLVELVQHGPGFREYALDFINGDSGQGSLGTLQARSARKTLSLVHTFDLVPNDAYLLTIRLGLGNRVAFYEKEEDGKRIPLKDITESLLDLARFISRHFRQSDLDAAEMDKQFISLKPTS